MNSRENIVSLRRESCNRAVSLTKSRACPSWTPSSPSTALLDQPHTAYVRTLEPSEFNVADAPAITDLLAGQVQVYVGGLPPSIEYIKAGKLDAVAVTTSTRSEALPGVPAVDEFVPGYEASTVFGLGAPKNTPTEIIATLNKEINAAQSDPQFKARLVDLGGTVLSGSPADYGKLIADETEKWSKVIKFSNIKAW